MGRFELKWVFLILFIGSISAQSNLSETDDPNEQEYMNTLLKILFHPLKLELADSISLRGAGFSVEAVELILNWQRSGATKRGYQRMRKKFDLEDERQLSGTIHGMQGAAKVIFRQRLQYSASLQGWRVLHKGHIREPGLDLIFLAEQDPGEIRLTDHTILTLSSNQIPGLERIIIGDFHLAWGSGLLLNQTSSRVSLSPGSLVRQPRLTATPHYSTRETGYYRGMVVEWQVYRIQYMAFASSRMMMGSRDSGTFREDSDGIHPASKSYDRQTEQIAGLAGIYKRAHFKIYLASLLDSLDRRSIRLELGLYWQISQSQYVQVFTDKSSLVRSRSIASWSYKLRQLQLSIQYRYLPHPALSTTSSVITLLGSKAVNEAGFSARLQVRPRKQMVFRYSIDTGTALYLTSLADMRRVTDQKAQFHLKTNAGIWQLDWGCKRVGPIVPDHVWQGESRFTQVTKMAGSLSQKISTNFFYRLNLKTASNQANWSILLQQRVFWASDGQRVTVGLVRYDIPEHALRLSIYESNVVESFSFFTAYNDGQRWFIYLSSRFNEHADLEFRLSQTLEFEDRDIPKQVEFSFQLSVVF